MGRKIICPKCNTIFDETLLEQKNSENTCLVCAASLLGDEDDFVKSEKEKRTYYYYKGAGGTLTTTLYDDETPLYIFEAVDIQDAERQLKEVMPNSPLINNSQPAKVCCPYCRSTEYTLLNRGYSIFTGFLGSGKVKRVCNKCKKEF